MSTQRRFVAGLVIITASATKTASAQHFFAGYALGASSSIAGFEPTGEGKVGTLRLGYDLPQSILRVAGEWQDWSAGADSSRTGVLLRLMFARTINDTWFALDMAANAGVGYAGAKQENSRMHHGFAVTAGWEVAVRVIKASCFIKGVWIIGSFDWYLQALETGHNVFGVRSIGIRLF